MKPSTASHGCAWADLAAPRTRLAAALRDLDRVARSRGSRLDHHLTRDSGAEPPEPGQSAESAESAATGEKPEDG